MKKVLAGIITFAITVRAVARMVADARVRKFEKRDPNIRADRKKDVTFEDR